MSERVQQREPLWVDGRIHDEVGLRFARQEQWAKAVRVALLVRDEYEAHLATLRAENERLRAELADLRQTIEYSARQIDTWEELDRMMFGDEDGDDEEGNDEEESA
jgi:uncharacterized small protein (DUF1192 family)